MLASCIAAAGLLLTGCAHDSDEVARLRGELTQTQEERDRLELRVRALEARPGASEPYSPPSDAGAGDGPPTPELRVVRLSPPSEGKEPLDGWDPSSDRTSAASPERPDRRKATPEERRAYDAAIALYRAKQPEKALSALAGFLVRWPDSPYADDATYWRGECYFALHDWAHAIEHFEAVRSRRSGREADALLRIGLARQKLGDRARADEAFEDLRREYPDSTAARQVSRGRDER
jgi:tol-pal system protein YbgF